MPGLNGLLAAALLSMATALLAAGCFRGGPAAIGKLLLEAGADRNSRDPEGKARR